MQLSTTDTAFEETTCQAFDRLLIDMARRSFYSQQCIIKGDLLWFLPASVYSRRTSGELSSEETK